jgi:hypothetical protein
MQLFYPRFEASSMPLGPNLSRADSGEMWVLSEMCVAGKVAKRTRVSIGRQEVNTYAEIRWNNSAFLVRVFRVGSRCKRT